MRSGRHVPNGTPSSLPATTLTGTLTLSDVNIALGTATGTQLGTSSSQKLAVYGATPVVRPTAFTQTFATAGRTHAARTATTIATADSGIDLTAAVALLNEVKGKVNALIADLANTAGVLNQVIDDDQAFGLRG